MVRSVRYLTITLLYEKKFRLPFLLSVKLIERSFGWPMISSWLPVCILSLLFWLLFFGTGDLNSPIPLGRYAGCGSSLLQSYFLDCDALEDFSSVSNGLHSFYFSRQNQQTEPYLIFPWAHLYNLSFGYGLYPLHYEWLHKKENSCMSVRWFPKSSQLQRCKEKLKRSNLGKHHREQVKDWRKDEFGFAIHM